MIIEHTFQIECEHNPGEWSDGGSALTIDGAINVAKTAAKLYGVRARVITCEGVELIFDLAALPN